MTVSCFINGGLGNQLFQIFTTIAYGMEHQQLFLFQYYDHCGPRPTYWRNFLNHLSILTTANPIHEVSNSDIDHYPHMREQQEMKYHPLAPPFSNVRLHGYFQSPRYFDKYRQDIFELIQLEAQKRQIRQDYDNYYVGQTAQRIPVISMHFRLGDYKGNPCHNVLEYEYYEQAVERMQLIYNAPNRMRVLFFCEAADNDIVYDKIRRLAQKFLNVEFVKVDDQIEDWKQMLLMSLCDSNIIANSTFSWWGAYFNTTPNRQVVYPKQWFGPGLSHIDMEAADTFPQDWHRI